MKTLLIFSLVLGMVLGLSGVVAGSGQQANEEGAMFQMWDLAPANLDAYDNPQGICDENLVETIIVFANDTDGISSEEVLDKGTTYVLRVSGTAYAGDTIYFDAKYSITERIIGDDWTDLVSGYENYGEGLLDLKVNGEFVDWGPYNEDHVYYTRVENVGSQLNLKIYDTYYTNNEGFLVVEIYNTNIECTKACATIPDGDLYTSGGELIPIGFNDWGYNYQGRIFNGMYCDYHPDVRPGGAKHDACMEEYGSTHLIMKWNDAWLSNKDCDGDGLLDRHLGHDSYIGSGAWLTNTQTGTYDLDGEECHWSYFTKIVAVPEDASLSWNLIGDWILEFNHLGSLYIHDMTVVDNTFTGVGGYPSGGEPYVITWTVNGSLHEDDIEMKIEYDDSSYYADAVGTIAPDGTMSGTWSNASQSGTWESTQGSASKYWYASDGAEIGQPIWGSFAIIFDKYSDSCTEDHGVLYRPEAVPIGFGFWDDLGNDFAD